MIQNPVTFSSHLSQTALGLGEQTVYLGSMLGLFKVLSLQETQIYIWDGKNWEENFYAHIPAFITSISQDFTILNACILNSISVKQ